MPRKKQRRAWGSITEVQRGKRYVLRWPDPSKRCGRASLTVRGTYREACERLDVIHAEALAAPDVPRGWTVGRIFEEYVREDYSRRIAIGKIKPKSVENYEYSWRKSIEPRWRDVAIEDIKPGDVQEWLMTLSRGHAEQSLIVLKKVGDMAVRNELADRNVFRSDYLLPKPRRPRSRDTFDGAAADAALGSLRGSAMEGAFILMAFGGCRTGEALGVRACEVEPFKAEGMLFATVPVVRRMEAGGTAPAPDHDLKTPESDRVTVIPPPYAGRLLELSAAKRAAGVEWLTDRGDGLPMNRHVAQHRWTKLLPDGERIPMQNLRTSWRTMAALEWGVSSDVLEMVMGHRLPGTTGHHYMRPSWEQIAARFAAEFAKNGVD